MNKEWVHLLHLLIEKITDQQKMEQHKLAQEDCENKNG